MRPVPTMTTSSASVAQRRAVLRPGPAGVTLIELLAVIAILGVLLTLLLPAVQSARESGRRTTCLNNVRQVGLAMNGFESANGFFPPARSTESKTVGVWPPHDPKEHSFFAMALPFMENGQIFSTLGYDYDQNWNSPANQPAAQTSVASFVCPSAPEGARKITADRYPNNEHRTKGYACVDYAPLTFVETSMYSALGMTAPGSPSSSTTSKFVAGMLQTNRRIKSGHIRDGLSGTLAIAECANRPLRMIGRVAMGPRSASVGSTCNAHNNTAKAAWADSNISYTLHGADARLGVPNTHCFTTDATGVVGPPSGGTCVMNCTNWDEMYSFHPGGVTGVFGDGSTRFLGDDIDGATMISIITRMGSDAVGEF